MKELYTDRLYLRKYTPEDAAKLYELLGSDPVMSQYTGWNPHASLAMSQATVDQFISNYAKPHFYGWAITKEDVIIGTIGAYDYEEKDQSIEVGYSIGQAYWGQGYAVEALGAVIACLQEEGIGGIRAWSHEKNMASVRVLEKAGFVCVGEEEMEVGNTKAKQLIYEKKVNHPVIFRHATKEDIPLILSFIRQLAAYEEMEDQVVATEELLEEWIYEKKTAEVIFAMEGDKEVGFALFFQNFSTFLGRAGIYLEDLFVMPEYRGKGYGKALLQKLAAIAVERGCGRLEWWCLDWNKPSIDFYLSLGAEAMDEWTVYRIAGDTLKEMAKQV